MNANNNNNNGGGESLLFAEIPVAAQSAYQQLYETAHHAETQRSIASLTGSFQFKEIKERRYWYYAYRDVIDGRVRQIYIGPDSARVEELKRSIASSPANPLVIPLAKSAIALGCPVAITPKHFRILRQLADSRFFHAGGILIGTHAFLAMAPMLGVKWLDVAPTADLDFAHVGGRGAGMTLGLPADIEVDVHSAIDTLAMGFLPSVTMQGGQSGTYVSSNEAALRLDFVTPQRRSDEPVAVPGLGLTLQPMRFIDYLIERPAQCCVFTSAGAVVVSVPEPARFALHKLIVASDRPLRDRIKTGKDLRQAASLIGCLLQQMPDSLVEAWNDIQSRGPAWRKLVSQSLERMAATYPDVHASFQKYLASAAAAAASSSSTSHHHQNPGL